MSKFESNIKQIPYRQQAVFDMLSDLNNVDRAKTLVPDDKLDGLVFDHDSVKMSIPPVGEVAIKVVERQEPKCIKFESVSSPVPFNLWIQMLPVTETTSKMKLTIEAELNPFVRGMVSKPLQEGLEKLADAFAMIKYE